LRVEDLYRRPDRVVIEARVRAATGACRRCGGVSGRVHGSYERQLRDAAAGGAQVVILLRVRRFRCGNAACPAVTFTEQVEGLTSPHSRFTPLLAGLLTQIGLALAGRAGVRLAAAVGVVVGRDTLLRLVKALPEPAVGLVPVLGVDDFAFRRGRHYGTVLIDMATHRPIEIFDGRDGADLAAWLRRHREVAVICRDRSSGYGEGARAGAPQAVQVADRFHLWQNLGQAVEKTVNTRRAHLGEPAPRPPGETPPAVVQLPAEKKIVTRLRTHYEAVQQLHAQGLSKAAIGRKLGLHPATVRKFATARGAEDLIAKTEQRTHRRVRRCGRPARHGTGRAGHGGDRGPGRSERHGRCGRGGEQPRPQLGRRPGVNRLRQRGEEFAGRLAPGRLGWGNIPEWCGPAGGGGLPALTR
jgi:DNA-binding NarL/FixJ family response regulator